MEHLSLQIRSNRSIAENMRELVFDWPEHADEPLPGQFLTLRSALGSDPLLRRPFAFSAFSRDDRSASIIYQKRGKATEHLAAADPGETIDVVGPLGTSFGLPENGRLPVLAGGGIGLGPVLFLAASLAEAYAAQWDGRLDRDGASPARDRAPAAQSGESGAGNAPVLVLGARTASFLPDSGFFAARLKSSVRLILCTDDGSAGLRGTVLDGIRSLSDAELALAEISCCGPTPMLRSVAAFAEQYGLPCSVSMEQIMACAVGACMGCVIRVRSEKRYARVCKEGPVFDASYIDWSAT